MTITPEQQDELIEVTHDFDYNETRRAIASDLEELLGKVHSCLDHGFVRIVDYMGNDSSIVQAARVSYGRGTKHTADDKNLIEYLMRHKHTTPFEQCEIKFHVKLPIFVARQWIRHRTANVNEYSARYSILANEFYIPEQQNVAPQSKTNRQGRSEDHLDYDEYDAVSSCIKGVNHIAYGKYEYLLNENEMYHGMHPGIARELARMVLPLNSYTEWYWKIDLYNLFHFLMLRKDKHAQYEIRVYADIIGDIVQKWCPIAYDAWLNCQFEAKHFTRRQWQIIYKTFIEKHTEQFGSEETMKAAAEVWNNANGIGKREFDELVEMLK